MNYKIEKDIPMPSKFHKKYPFEEMEVGDSLIFCDYSRHNLTLASNAARNWARKGKHNYKFSIRKTDDNKVRIWRIM